MRSVIAGNWKMNKTADEVVILVQELIECAPQLPDKVEVIIAPAFPFLAEAVQMCKDTALAIAAQNCHFASAGAFTGEVSVPMLKSIGVEYCIVGHSERRQYFNEQDSDVGKKLKALLDEGLTPIYCCGEREEERSSGAHFDVVGSQLNAALAPLDQSEVDRIIIAYEPVWAIGTGLTASAEQAQEMHAFIRAEIGSSGSQVPILYGGSCKPSNSDELFACADVNGGLIGGASLNASDFQALVNSLSDQKHLS
jgi:triosephosphate isomerase